ncbi:MAG: hypothetical protein ACPG31_02450 [Planctomycetota bacterium]
MKSPIPPILILSLLAPALGAQQVGPLPPGSDPTLAGPGVGVGPGSGDTSLLGSSSGFDDFNRADGPLGVDWSAGSGSFEVRNNKFVNVGAANGWAKYNGATSLYDQAVVEFDLEPDPPILAFNAAIIGAGGTDMTFTKVQGTGTYTNVGFYHGVNGGGLGVYGGFFTITPVSGGRVRVYVTNGGDTMNCDIDENTDGVYEYHYESSGLIASGLAAQLGQEVGLSVYSTFSRADDFSVNGAGPEPVLQVMDIVPGEFMTVDISNLDEGSQALLILSSLGAGPTLTPFGEIEVSQPWRRTPLFPEVGGVVNFTSTLPPGSLGVTFYMQAAEWKVDDSILLTNPLELLLP